MPFHIAPAVAADCFARLGVAAPRDIGGAGDLLTALAATLPTGSTAKNEAVAAGRVPPGDDPTRVAETWLARPGLGWSCWAVATLYSALVTAGGEVSAAVLGARRVDPATAPVDVHSVVELGHRGQRWLTDPYFWMAPVPAPVGEAWSPAGWGHAVRVGDAWHTAVGTTAGSTLLRYRTFTLPLIRDDVDAFCRISLTHTGVSARPRVHLATEDGMVAASVGDDGAVRWQRWRRGRPAAWGAACETVEMGSWDEVESAVAALASDRSSDRRMAPRAPARSDRCHRAG